jgi:hypothetical protein
MALMTAYSLDNGVDLPAAYIRVVGVRMELREKIALIQVDVYKDAEFRQAGKPIVARLQYEATGEDYAAYFGYNVLDMQGVNCVSQSYQFINDRYFPNATTV